MMEKFKIIERDREFQDLRDEFKIPFACYGCNKLMENWDDKYFFKYKVCSKCAINYIEDRDLDPELLKDRNRVLDHVKEMIKKSQK